MTKIQHVVADSGAFIKNVHLEEYSDNIYTVSGAIKEIKDKETRQRLQVLPYNLIIKEPSPDAYKFVLEFSKKTGDFASLSVTDLQIIALTYQLEKENVGTDHLKLEPSCKVTDKPSSIYNGFQKVKDSSIHAEDKDENSNHGELIENLESNDNEDEEDSETDDDGWITSENISEVQRKMGAVTIVDDPDVCVACITTDFAVQNVLIQIGLNVTSVECMLIKNIRVFILRCHACFKTTSNMTKQFCPNCGNKSLKKVAVTYNEDGSQNIHINFKKRLNIRGTRYSLPMPKGGKHASNPVLFEDQPVPQNRPSKKALQKIDAFSPDYEVLSSPFAMNDIYSRAASLGIGSKKNGNKKKNPNEWSVRTGNRKSKK